MAKPPTRPAHKQRGPGGRGAHGSQTGPARGGYTGHAQGRGNTHPNAGGPVRNPRGPGGARHVARHPPRKRDPHEPQTAQPEAPTWTKEQLEAALRDRPLSSLRPGEWLWTTREGAERDLLEELLAAAPNARLKPRRAGAALAVSADSPGDPQGRLEVTFARQAFRISHVAHTDDVSQLAAALTPTLRELIANSERYALHVFVPDSTQANALASRAQALQALLIAPTNPPAPSAADQAAAAETDVVAADADTAIADDFAASAHDSPAAMEADKGSDDDDDTRPPSAAVDDATLRRYGGTLIQVCVCDARTTALGAIASDRALSLWAGGRARMRLGGAFPSRAARKLAEAFAWVGISPGAGELCVDLGAAPGGWSWLLLEKKARVIAVDPARMDPALAKNPRLRHVQGNAFDYFPDEPADWLFCDMAYRPLEVAQMLGRWARRRQTRLLIANFKLPMKRKVEMVARIRDLLAQQGFVGIRTRQLYHDREEITLAAHVG